LRGIEGLTRETYTLVGFKQAIMDDPGCQAHRKAGLLGAASEFA